jgi:deoxyribodipyrimidine photo-lyase
MSSSVIVWFRDDLRLNDNPALLAAIETGLPVLALYILDETSDGIRPLGAASKWWLHHSLASLAKSLADRGIDLALLQGPAAPLIAELVAKIQPSALYWNRRYGKAERDLDAKIKADCLASGVDAKSFNGAFLYEPWEVTTKTGGPMKVFTPFWRAAQALMAPAQPRPVPTGQIMSLKLPASLNSLSLEQLSLLPKLDWAKHFPETWTPGEQGAHEKLGTFFENAFEGYAEGRNRPDYRSTSLLAPHLRFGEISVREIFYRAGAVAQTNPAISDADLRSFRSELGWREFSNHLLFHNPALATENYNRTFDAFPWKINAPALHAWQKGLTGYPIVDAGMRELWQTGFMHNRVRMIVASFLIKHLLIDWRVGEKWFWDTLLDADPANNAASWQWVAGSGADAAPYYRIFNPMLQGEKFDPDGTYVRKYVPELAGLRAPAIHTPWLASSADLRAANVHLGKTYPHPIVDHAAAREQALSAFKALKESQN